MFRWSSAFRFSLRLHQAHSIKTELLVDHLKKCSNEYQVLQLIGMNRTRLTVDHVSCAMTLLWNIQEGKPSRWATLSHVRDHPEFSALRALAHHNVELMNDNDLVDVLYALIRFQVEAHDPLVQQLVVEGWKRLECLDLQVLSKFAYCLKKQDMTSSPLMGQIANIVGRSLDDTSDATALSNFLTSLSTVSSPDLQERLIKKTESVIEKLNASNFRHARRVMHLFPKYKYSCASLLDKCDQFFQHNINAFDRDSLCSITAMYHSLHLYNTDFLVMAKEKLMGMVDLCNDASSFAKLYATLGCMTSEEERKRLDEKLLTYADEMQLAQLLAVLKAMEDTECTNIILINKIASLLQKHLHVCKPAQLKLITESLVQLQYQNAVFFKELQMHLKRNIISNYKPFEVAAMIRSLSLLLDDQVDEAVIAKINAIIPQCTLPNLEKMAVFLTQLQKVHISKYESATYKKLLKKMNHYGLERIQKMENIDHLLNELRHIETMHWMTTGLRVGMLDSCQRLLYQVTWRNVTQLSVFVMQMNTLRSSFYEKITSVVMEDITKIHPSYIYLITRPFSMLNYDSSQEKEFFNLCIQYVLDHLDSFSPSFLTMVGFNFALSGYFPKDLIKAIFNTPFLSKLDASTSILLPNHNLNTRLFLMKLNRAVCIEHPEYLIPWFHSSFCKQVQRSEITSTHTEIHQLLGEILGGTNYTKMSVLTPYSYSIDFEYILDSNKKPIEYMEDNSISANWLKEHELSSQVQENKPLPQGAQRFAVVLLRPRVIVRYSSHLKGPYVMMKRHLEILGYHVVQIPLYEWKQLTLESEVTQKTYLRKKIFPDNL
ncbi:FAST kinase domain-containing protein 1, mitochondrial [Pseudophryne corroboree]|uniref:FAST kinase domain-containing protein 1, mitochondrial n=1 Tax=Pseudophryne corroboree TaxID=495146 RepID=UPI0030820652